MVLSRYILLLLIQLYAVSGWGSMFIDSAVGFTAGRLEWRHDGGDLRVWPWAEEGEILGVVSRDIEVISGLVHIASIQASCSDPTPLELALSIYPVPSDSITFETLISPPIAEHRGKKSHQFI